VNAVVDNNGEIVAAGGEIEFLDPVTSSDVAAKLTLQNGVARFPKSGTGFDTTTGLLATTAGTNDIYGTVRIQGTGSRIVVSGESTAVFHDPVTNNGGTIQVFPGSTAIYLQGLTTMGNSSVLSIQLADPDDEPDLGQVEVATSAQLAGNLELSLATGFTPTLGDTFQILSAAGGITGSLNLATAPPLPGSMQWNLTVGPTAVVASIVATGDYNGNGMVDAADYVLWRDALGQAGTNLAADGNGSGMVDAADYDIWRSRFGNTLGTSVNAPAATLSAVPEPATMGLFSLAALLLTLRFSGGARPARTRQCPLAGSVYILETTSTID
jgi:hypothetical protein